MNSPNPVSTGWSPTTSTIGGGVLGGAFAQVLVAVIEALSHQPLSSQLTGAITTLSVALIGYFFPDGGRK